MPEETAPGKDARDCEHPRDLRKVLLRKGGVREPVFKAAADSFLLFPTGFHTDPQLLESASVQPYFEDVQWDPKEAQSIPLKCFAKMEDCFTTEDTAVFDDLSDLHVWTADFKLKRLETKRAATITAMLLRVYHLKEPVVVEQDEDFWGCFSWVNVPDGLSETDMSFSQAAVSEEDWTEVRSKFAASRKKFGGAA